MKANWLYLSDLRTLYVGEKFEMDYVFGLSEPHYEVAGKDVYALMVALGLPPKETMRDGVILTKPEDHCLRIMPVVEKIVVKDLSYTVHIDYLNFTFTDDNDMRRRRTYNGVYLVDSNE